MAFEPHPKLLLSQPAVNALALTFSAPDINTSLPILTRRLFFPQGRQPRECAHTVWNTFGHGQEIGAPLPGREGEVLPPHGTIDPRASFHRPHAEPTSTQVKAPKGPPHSPGSPRHNDRRIRSGAETGRGSGLSEAHSMRTLWGPGELCPHEGKLPGPFSHGASKPGLVFGLPRRLMTVGTGMAREAGNPPCSARRGRAWGQALSPTCSER